MLNFQSSKSPIARRLILYVILFSSFITLLITAIQLYRDYHTDLNLIHSELQQIEGVHLESLTSALWASNRKLLQTSIEGILKIRDMQYIEIHDAERVWANAGTKTHNSSDNNTIHRSYPMNYQHRNRNINIGELTVIVSLDGVYQRLLNKVWIILISNALKTFLVAIFIYFLFHHLVTRHLSKISEYAEDHNPLSDNKPLTLDRNIKYHDEFDSVVESINDMHHRLHEQMTKIDEQKQYLLQTLNSIGDAVIVTDTQGDITQLNPVAEQLTGWSLEEARGLSVKSIFQIVNASTHKPIENPVEKVIASGETVYLSNHTTLIAKDGREYQIADSAAPIRDENNNILGTLLVFNDVTEAYQLRHTAAASRKKYQTLTTVSPVGIFYTDKQGSCLYVNKKWSEITGIPAEEAMGDGWVKSLHPQDKKNVFTEWNRCAKEGIPFKFEYRFQQTSSVRWVLGEAIAEEGENAEVIGYVGTITDITDRKIAEETLEKSSKEWTFAMDFFEDAIYLIDLDDKLVRANYAFYKMTGLTPENAIGRDITSIIHPQGEEIPCPVCKARKELRDEVIVMEENHPDNPTQKPIQITVQIVRDTEGSPVSVLMGIRDLSKIRDAEKEKNYLQYQLHQSQKMDALGKLTGGIAHDYNNMLGIIMGYADILEEKLSDQPKLIKYAQNIHYAGKRGAKLTKKLLSFSQQKISDAENLNLNTMLHEQQDMLQKTLTARIKLTFELADNLWPTWLDRGDLEDSIVNLCINASHAMEGKGKLTIMTRNMHFNKTDAHLSKIDPGDYILLSITDTGCGMSDTIKEKIFDPFYSTKGDKGTGLGLSQVYGFIKRSNGTIKVYSEPDHGTKITLYFPRHEKNIPVNNEHKENIAANIEGNETILVVDDEAALLELTCEILNIHGYKTIRAENGKQALKALENETIDLLLSDIIMPEMDGYELSSIVKDKYPDIKIQLISGFNDVNHTNMIDKILNQNLLYKPYNSQTLLKKVRELLK